MSRLDEDKRAAQPPISHSAADVAAAPNLGQLPPSAADRRLFLSYKREDWEQIKSIVPHLEAVGQAVWFDVEGIPPGTDWLERIGVAIERSRAVVAFMSAHFQTSRICMRELVEAERLDKKLIIVALSDLRSEDVPDSIQEINWIDGTLPPESIAGEILEAVAVDTAWLDEHARLYAVAQRALGEGGTSHLLRGTDLRQTARLLDAMSTRALPPRVTPAMLQLVAKSRQRRRRNWAAAALTTLAVAMITTLYFVAERARTVSESQRVAAGAELKIDDQLDLAIRLGLYAHAIDQNPTTQSVLLSALTSGPGMRASTQIGTSIDAAALTDGATWALLIDDNSRPRVLHTPSVDSKTVDGVSGGSTVAVVDSRTGLIGSSDGHLVWIDLATASAVAECQIGGRITAIAGAGDYALVALFREPDTMLAIIDQRDCATRDAGTIPGFVTAAVMAGDGTWWAVGGSEVGLLVRDGAKHPLDFGPRRATELAISGRDLWAGTDDGSVLTFPEGSVEAEFFASRVHRQAVSAISVSDTLIVTAGVDGRLLVWDRGSRTLLAELENRGDDRSRVSLLAAALRDDSVITTIGTTGVIQEWSTTADSTLSAEQTSDRIEGVAITNAGVLAATANGVIEAGGRPSAWPDAAGPATALAGQGAVVAAGSQSGDVLVRIGDDDWVPVTSHERSITNVAVNADGLVASTDGVTLRVADVAGRDEVVAEGTFFSVAVSPSDRIYAGRSDGGALVWAANVPPQNVFAEHRGTLDAVVISPDGRWVATGGDDRIVRLWDAKSQALGRTLVGHDERVLDLAFNGDGSRLLSVDESGAMLLWDLTTMSQLGTPIRHATEGIIQHVAWAAGTDDVAYTGGPGLFRWRFGLDDLVAEACGVGQHRVLTPAEALQHFDSAVPEDPCKSS